MITITNGTNTCTVTNSAYENIYRKQGFYPVITKKTDNTEEVGNTEEAEDNRQHDDITEKPIAQWSKAEVKKFAEENGIDISGTRSANEAKAIIKDWIAENE